MGQEDPLENGMATHSSILAWKISWTERSLVGYSPWDRKESDTTEQLHWFTGSTLGHSGLFPGWGVKISHASWSKIENIKQKQYYNKCNKDF